MKLGKETGSTTNWMMSRFKCPEPKVGDGATILMWTDRHAATIVKVSKCRVYIQRDKATRTDNNGYSESQTYSFSRDFEAPIEKFCLTKNGWKKAGGGETLLIGTRDEYCDYSF